MSARLDDFTYPGEGLPEGVMERGLSKDAVSVIGEEAASIRRGLDVTGQRRDCRRACGDWIRALSKREIDVQLLGGEGIDGEVVTSDYRVVPPELASGYREDDDLVHRHYWLGIGAERLIFDPTAYQFDDKGGVSFDRYTIDGESLTTMRAKSWGRRERRRVALPLASPEFSNDGRSECVAAEPLDVRTGMVGGDDAHAS